jgi:hypothetical protein
MCRRSTAKWKPKALLTYGWPRRLIAGRAAVRAALVLAAGSRGSRLPGVGFAAGQGEQRLVEAFLLGVGGEQVPADGLPGGGGGGRVGEGDLEQGAFPGQGVRSSCEALAAKRRWSSNEASSHASRLPGVSPSTGDRPIGCAQRSGVPSASPCRRRQNLERDARRGTANKACR